jgi:hypothetical protein
MSRFGLKARRAGSLAACSVGLLLAFSAAANAQQGGHGGPYQASAEPVAISPIPAADTAGSAVSGGDESAKVPDSRSLPASDRRFVVAGGQVFALNLALWALNYSLRGHATFRIGAETMWRNFGRAQWDVNRFGMNQFGHPYNGGLYYNAGRSNGYGLVPSAAFAFIGSYMWECCFEAEPTSINDLVNTSLGGVSFGETTHRLAALTYRPGAAGLEAFGRGALGFLLDPMGGVTRLFTGRTPAAGRSYLGAGSVPLRTTLRAGGMSSTVSGDPGPAGDRDGPVFDLDLAYGDPFARERAGPYDYFNSLVQVDFTSRTPLSRLSIDGVLFSRRMGRADGSRHVLGLNQRFELIRNDAFEYGGPSLTGGLTSEFPMPGGLDLRTFVGLDGIILGAVESEHIVSRSHDYGPGLGAIADVRVGRRSAELLRVGYSGRWIHVLDGTARSHFVQTFGARASAPILGPIAAGFDYVVYLRSSRFRDFEEVRRRQNEARVFLSYESR